MDEDKPIWMKCFGYLPESPIVQPQSKEKMRQSSQRHYLNDTMGIYLTSREAEVSYHVAKGCTVREAAEKMKLSPRTAEFYLGNVRRKLGVRNKYELLRMLFDNDFFLQLEKENA